MRIAFYEIKDWEEDYLKEKLPGHQLSFYAAPFSDEDLPEAEAEALSTFVGSPVTPKVLQHCPNLKFVATRTTGYDHINLEACVKAGVKISNVPAYGDNTVAEFAFALILALARKMYPAIKRIKEEAWYNYEGLRGFDLKGKTIGIVGTGRIGAYAVKIAHGFGMKIVAFDPHPTEQLKKDFAVEYLPVEDLLKVSDIVSLHVPYMPSTHHLINKNNIQFFKKGAILVNTARGGLVDTASLVEALHKGFLGGAALDVLEEEGFIKDEIHMLIEGHPKEEEMKTVLADHELMHMENVIITPHNAFNTLEALKRILDTTVENIEGFTAGEAINLVK